MRRTLHKVFFMMLILIINVVLSICLIDPIVHLNENQILYSMSTFAQVIGSLFGLVLAAYAIIDPKLKEIGSKDQKATDYVDLLRKGYYENIIILSIMCLITILSCIATINLYEVLSNKLFSVLVNQSILCGVISMISFLYFGCSLLNPNAIAKYGEEERKEIEDYYDYRKSNNEFRPFVLYYNKLETLVTTFANELMEKDLNLTQTFKNKNNRILLFQALDILMMNEIINKEIYDVIDNLRRYRNALVHSVEDEKVNAQIFDELKSLYLGLSKIYENIDNDNLRQEAIRNLYNYGHKIAINEIDKKIIMIIQRNSKITLNEIASELSYSRSSIANHLKKLQAKNIITHDFKGYHLKDNFEC